MLLFPAGKCLHSPLNWGARHLQNQGSESYGYAWNALSFTVSESAAFVLNNFSHHISHQTTDESL